MTVNTHRSLVSFGDSFTYGTELSDCVNQHSNKTWTALCAKDLGLIYQCLAKGGWGNQAISHEIFRKYSESQYKNKNFYVINWAWIERFDYIDIDSNDWKTVHPRHENLLSHFFYRHIDNQNWNLIRNLQIIYSTIKFLESQGCDFFMTCIDDNLFGENYSNNHASTILTLQSLVKPYIHTIEDKNFYSWSMEKKFPNGPNGHPLEQAHAAASEYWLKKIKHQLHFEDSK